MKIMIAINPCDFRRGMDSLAGLCKQQFALDPLCGIIFVFRNRCATAIKVLAYDGTGMWLIHKRFSEGKLLWWPKQSSEHVLACLFSSLPQGKIALVA
jgi:transposase